MVKTPYTVAVRSAIDHFGLVFLKKILSMAIDTTRALRLTIVFRSVNKKHNFINIRIKNENSKRSDGCLN